MLTNDDVEVVTEPAEIKKFKALAVQIKGNLHLAAILQTVPVDRREPIYTVLKPYLKYNRIARFDQLKFY